MDTNLFWFNGEQWMKMVPHLPANRPAPKRKDGRQVPRGIMHLLKVDCRWQDCPKDYGPDKTVYNRFSRWSKKGVWQTIFEAAAGPSDPPKQAALEASQIKVHRCANGGKGGLICSSLYLILQTVALEVTGSLADVLRKR